MNVAAAYVAREWARLDLSHLGAGDRIGWLAVTPRFRASAHVVFLGVPDGASEPVLVAKVSRLPGRSAVLAHEAHVLRAVQAARPGGFPSVPRLVADDVVGDVHLLVETGVPGRLLDAHTVRRRPGDCASALVDWITELHGATAMPDGSRDAFSRLVATPLDELERRLPPSAAMDRLLARTRELVAPLRDLELPLVTVHGDLGAPNILLTGAGELGVVDWELAEEASLPAQDLFFALAYVAFAQVGARGTPECLAAFERAFFVRGAWTQPYVARYAAALGLPAATLRPLFVACWSRYVARRAARLADGADAPLDAATAAWLAQDRYLALWDHAVRHADALHLPR